MQQPPKKSPVHAHKTLQGHKPLRAARGVTGSAVKVTKALHKTAAVRTAPKADPLDSLLLGAPDVSATPRDLSRLTESAPVKGLASLLRRLSYFSARGAGFFLLGFAATLFVLCFTGHLFLYEEKAPFSQLVIAVASFVLGMLLLPGRRPLALILADNRLLCFLFFTFLCLKRPRTSKTTPQLKGGLARRTLMVLLGVGYGFCTAFFSPPALVGIAALLLFVGCAFASPECCLVVAALSLPFLSLLPHTTLLLALPVSLLLLSFFRKVLLGKRIFRYTALDRLVLVFAFFYAVGGLFAYSGTLALKQAALFVLFVAAYFPAANLLANRRAAYATVGALLTSGLGVCIIGLIQQFSGHATADWLDPSMFTYIDGRIFSVFQSGPNVLALYLVMLAPLCFYVLTRCRRFSSALGALLLTAVYILTLVYTWSRGAWVAAAFSLLVFTVLMLRHKPLVLLTLSAITPYVLLLLPESLWQRLISLANLGDSSISYRISVWRSSLRMLGDHLLTGVGTGTEAFQSAYAAYAAQGAEKAEHAHNLLLQMGIEVGIIPLLLFMALLVLLSFVCLHRPMRKNKSPRRPLQMACFASLVGVIVMGAGDYPFYDLRMLFLFFLVAGLLVATARGRVEDMRRATSPSEADPTAAALDVAVTNPEFLYKK